MSEIKNLNCPDCGVKMERGYVYSGRDIKWSDTDEAKFTTIGDEKLLGVGWSITMVKALAYRCRTCEIVTFKHNSNVGD